MDCRNIYELRIFGMKRSGNHPIINWLASLPGEPVYFFNDCGRKTDPYKTKHPRGDDVLPFKEDIYVQIPRMVHWKEERIRPIRFKKKCCLMYSYEDFKITYLKNSDLMENREYLIGRSAYIFNVIIIRDVYNWLASIIKARKDTGGSFNVRRRIRLWKSYARNYLNNTSFLEGKSVYILFNQWFTDIDYRETVAKKFGFVNSDRTLNYVGSVRDRGSSFDGIRFNSKAQEMRVLDRWRHFKDDRKFFDLLDSEAISLSKSIFGDIIGGDVTK